MAIGPTLQDARLKKQLTASQVAEMTRMKVQIVDDLEHDDFHRIAATIYGKGFIKLFAECVDLDPKPLIADYMRTVKGASEEDEPPAEASVAAVAPPPPAPSAPAEEPPPADLFEFASSRRRRITPVHAPRPAAEPRTLPPPPVSDPAVVPTRHHTRSVNRPLAATVRSLLQPLLDRGIIVTEALKTRLANFKWSDRMLKSVGIVLAALVLLLVLVAVIRYVTTLIGPRPPADHELILFIPPPEPYVE